MPGDELEAAPRAEPGNAKALTALGMVQGRTREPEAVDTFRKVVSLDPHSPDAHLNLGIALADQQRSEDALAEFAEAVKLAPGQAAPHYNKGRVLGDLRRYEEALPELQQACKLDASIPDAWFRLGIAERETQHYQEAVEAFRVSLKISPRQPDASYLLGQAYQTLGKSSEAINAWKSALDLDSNHAQALYSLSRALCQNEPRKATRITPASHPCRPKAEPRSARARSVISLSAPPRPAGGTMPSPNSMKRFRSAATVHPALHSTRISGSRNARPDASKTVRRSCARFPTTSPAIPKFSRR